MAQRIGSALKGGTVLQRSTSWAICRAAIEMFRHGVNIATVAVVRWAPDTDQDAAGKRRLHFMNGLPCAAIDLRLTFSRHRERPWFATGLVPDERMHQLWIDGESACSHDCYEVHDRSLHRPRNCAGLAADLMPQACNG